MTAHFSNLVVSLLMVLAVSSCSLLPGGRMVSMGDLMAERLSWMDEVAAVKQAKGLPIEDAAREADLLQAMEQKGEAVGIPREAVRGFFEGQMTAAKTLQVEWMKEHPEPGTGTLVDLGKTVRPALDDISARMIAALAKARESGTDVVGVKNRARAELQKDGYSPRVTEQAMSGLEAGLRP